MTAHLQLVEPPLNGDVLLDDVGDDEQRIAWPEPLASFNGLLICVVEGCGQMLQFKAGRAHCGRCGVAQFVTN